MWHFIGKGSIRSKWSYCLGRVVWAISKHLRPIPSPTVENVQRNRHLNLKNKNSENFKMLRNCHFNIFFLKKSYISVYEIIYNSSASIHQQLCARKKVCNTSRQQLENEKMRKIWNKGPFGHS